MDKNPDGRIHAVLKNRCQGCTVSGEISELFLAGKIEFSTVSVEGIEDHSKADGFSPSAKYCGPSRSMLSAAQPHFLVDLITLTLAIFNGLIYFLWWNLASG